MATWVDLAHDALRSARGALTAASSPAFDSSPPPGGGELLTPEALRASQQGWQRRVLELAEMVPEVAGAASLVYGSVSRIKFVVEGGEPAARREMQRRVDELDIARLAVLDFLSGEGYIIWPDVGEPYVCSVAEINTSREPFQVKDAKGAWVDLPSGHKAIRVWRPSLGNRWHATSPNKAAMDLIEAMYLHQLADSSVATSRLAGAGILVWPTSAKREGLDEDGNPRPGSQEELLRNFQRAALQSIKDRSSKDATIPFIVFVDPDPDSEWMPDLLRIDRDDHAEQYQQRFETYRLRYATTIDLPIEQTTGMGQTNHWSAWAIREDSWRAYLAPLVQRPVDALNKRVASKHGMRIVIDAADLLAKPDQTETIMQLVALDKVDTAYALDQLHLDSSKATEPPPRDYRSNVRPTQPSDFKVGGDRGGGRYRD